MQNDYQPLGYTFIALTKYYLGLLDARLKNLPIEKYYYPFWYIAHNSGNINQQQMAECLDIDKVAVVRVIDYLEKIQFVERQVNPHDRRCHTLHVTELGSKYVSQIEQALRDVDQLFLGEMKNSCNHWQAELVALTQKFKGTSKDEITFDYKRISKNEA